MKEQLVKYVDLLFAGAADAEDIKQEILQNTLDRYDDLIGQGKTPPAAYQLAISGIGDIHEILGTADGTGKTAAAVNPGKPAVSDKPMWKKVLQAIGIFLYIFCLVPLFILQNEIGLCGMLVFIALATALMILSAHPEKEDRKKADNQESPSGKLRKAIKMLITAIGLCVYFLLSFATQAWYITWVIFPIMAATQGLISACLDLKEVSNHES